VQIERIKPREPETTANAARASEKRLIPRLIPKQKQSSPANVAASIDLRIADLWMQGVSGATSPCARSNHLDAAHAQFTDRLDIPKLRFGELSTSRGLDDHITFSYYDFLNLKSLSEVQPDDVRYLEFTGSLHIPTRSVLDHFVREYFLHVHPVLPVVDERAFWGMYDDSPMKIENSLRLSLFVFQSMLFAACATMPLEVLRCCGFGSVRQARETFYRRAKTIFDLSKERDYYSVAQGALLLTYYTTNADPNMNTQWLSIAIQNARVVNSQLYHRDLSISGTERRSKKRLWWCCILRDRVMPLGCRRAVQITEAHFDFDQRFTEEDLEHEIGFSRVYDAGIQRQIVKTIVAQCDLAVVLTGVLSICYPMDGSHSLGRFASPDLTNIKDRIEQIRSNLLDWFTGFSLQAPLQTETNIPHVSVTLYTNLLYIYYHSARLALCQYEILHLKSTIGSLESDHNQILHHAKSEMRAATSATTGLVKVLIWLKCAQYLPISAVAYTALPLILTALDLKLSSDPAEATARRLELEVYVEVMRLYRKRFDGVEQLSSVVERLLNDAEPETRRICSTSGTTTLERSLVVSKKSKDWSDILKQRPKVYLRLALALDMALSRGSFPQESDFPTDYRIIDVNEQGIEDTYFSEKTLSNDFVDVTMPCMQPNGVLTPRTDYQEMCLASGHAQVNLDFADLFGDHAQKLQNYEGPHGYLDEVQSLFDLNVTV
jgi:hypothetical protein